MSEHTIDRIVIRPGTGPGTWRRVASCGVPQDAQDAVNVLKERGYRPGCIVIRTTVDGGLAVLGTDGGGGMTVCDGCGAKPDRWRASYKTTASGTCALRGREALCLDVRTAPPHSTVVARCPYCGHTVNAYT